MPSNLRAGALLLALLACATAAAAADPVARALPRKLLSDDSSGSPITIIVDSLFCGATGTINYSGCNNPPDQFEVGPHSSAEVFSNTNAGCMIDNVQATVSCQIDGRSRVCGQWNGDVSSDQWTFRVRGDALLGCWVQNGAW